MEVESVCGIWYCCVFHTVSIYCIGSRVQQQETETLYSFKLVYYRGRAPNIIRVYRQLSSNSKFQITPFCSCNPHISSSVGQNICHLLHACLKHDHKSLNTSPVMDWPDKSRVGYLYLSLNCLVWTFNRWGINFCLTLGLNTFPPFEKECIVLNTEKTLP